MRLVNRALVAVVLAAVAIVPVGAAETVKIGFITSLSGPAGIIGKHMKDSVELAPRSPGPQGRRPRGRGDLR